MSAILLVTINAKWIHPSLALRLLKANLGALEEQCRIVEFILRQPMEERINVILAAQPQILGISVSIWNHGETLKLLKELHKAWETDGRARPVIVLGGPEVSYLPPESEIFKFADHCIAGEGETAFRILCEGKQTQPGEAFPARSGYHLYTDEDLRRKLVYVEASRGCPYSCEFCLSAHSEKIREFPLEPFFSEMDTLIQRGARTFKFLDRSFNMNIKRAQQIMEFFLERIEKHTDSLVVHFEMVPSRFPPDLIETIARFPLGTLRLEIGIQTLNPEAAARISRSSNPQQELASIRLLREKTNAIIHADLIAGLPGEDMASFGRGFDALYAALSVPADEHAHNTLVEIQLGILKLLPGAPIARHTAAFGMCYNPEPPYEVMETSVISRCDLDRLKHYARFWELLVNRRLITMGGSMVFDRFMALSDSLYAHFGRSWGIPKNELIEAVMSLPPVLLELVSCENARSRKCKNMAI